MLPDELWGYIFSYLDIRSLLSCRKVCSIFRAEVDHMKIKKLAVSFYSDLDVEDYYYITNESTRCGYSLNGVKSFQFIGHVHAFRMLSNVQQLFIKCFVRNEQDFTNFELVNQLKQLEHLELVNVSIKLKEINLPILKVLRVCPANIFERIRLNTPNLIAFKATNTNLTRFRFIYPRSLRQMELRTLEYGMSKFVNVKSLYCSNGYSLANIISQLPNLEYLGFDVISKEMIAYLRKQRKVQRRPDLKLLFNGINIEEMDKIDNYIDQNAFNKLDKTEIYLDNYSKFDVLPFIIRMNYNELINYFNGTLPTDFFIKFINVRTLFVDAKSIVNHDQLVDFIINCKYLRTLSIENTISLGQHFFNHLHRNCPFLVDLKLKLDPDDELDLEFIYNLSFLLEFSINRCLDYELIRTTYLRLKYFEIFEFTLGRKTVEVVVKRYQIIEKVYSISISNSISKFDSIAHLFHFLRELIDIV